MDFISRVTPGLRELRVPLTTGYAWLTVAWMALSDRVLIPGAKGSLTYTVTRAVDALGRTASLAVLSLVAYLLGSFANDIVLLAVRRTWRVRAFRRLDGRLRRAWVVRVRQMAEQALWFRRELGERLAPTFDELERVQSEATLRIQLSLPLFAGGLTAAMQFDLLAVAGVLTLAAAVFAWHGAMLLGEAAASLQLLENELGDNFVTFQEMLWEPH